MYSLTFTDVLTEHGGLLLARDTYHSRLYGRPLMEHGAVLDRVTTSLAQHLLLGDVVLLDRRELVRVNCENGFITKSAYENGFECGNSGVPNAFITTSPMRLTGW